MAELKWEYEGNRRGPKGAKGLQGLPGVNAVENDAAVAAYIESPGSATRSAAVNLFGANSVRLFGAKGDGITDDSAAINAAIDAFGSVYFPAGVYKINSTILVPYNTDAPVGLEFANGARLVAGTALTEMVRMGAYDAATGPCFEYFRVTGGNFDGNGLAGTAIRVTSKLVSLIIDSVNIDRVTFCGLYLEDPDGHKTSHDSLVSNFRMNRQGPGTVQATYGIFAEGGDWQASNLYMRDCDTFIRSVGMLQIANAHFFNLATVKGSIGIRCSNVLYANNIYFDTITTGISLKNDDGTFSNYPCVLTDIFWYQYEAADEPVAVFHVCRDTPLHISGVETVFKKAAHPVRVMNVYTPAGERSFALTQFKSGVLHPGSTNPDDMAKSGAARNKQAIPLTSMKSSHAAGQGVCIGYVPARDTLSTRTQIMRVAAAEHARSNLLHFFIDYNSSGKPTSILRSTGEVVVSGSTASASVVNGVQFGNGKLWLGIKDAVMIDGRQFFPIYLFNDVTSLGYLSATYAEITGSAQPLLWATNAPWESGLTAASFLVTTKP